MAMAIPIPAAASSSNKQPDITPPCAAIQLVMALPWQSRSPPPATGTATTIEESNVDRTVQWLISITLLSFAIAGAVMTAISDCKGDGSSGGDDFITLLWLLPGHMLTYVYMAAAALARGHLVLFLPRAPVVVSDALVYYGFGAITAAVAFSNVVAFLLFHWLPCLMVAWFCAVGLLVAAVAAFWLCLVRTYSSCGDTSDWLLEMARRSSGPIGDGLAYLYSRLLYECAIRLSSTETDEDCLESAV